MMTLMALAAAAATGDLSTADEAAAFRAAGFVLSGGAWKTECEQPDGPPYEPGHIDRVADLNGDGLPEAIVTEGGSFCYGHTGTGFMLVSKQAGGKWVKLHSSPGIATILPTRANGWPEIEVGGPGFCFPVLRWNGKAFADHRTQYEGKPCRR